MDISQLADQLTALLGPAMSTLAGSKAVEAFSKESGKDAWNFVKSLWTKLEPAVSADPGLQQAVQAVQNEPEDKLNETVLRARLTQVLQKNSDLRDELVRTLDENKAKGKPEAQSYYAIQIQTIQGDFIIGNVTKAK